jgi:glycosyltransferase involved in cell wall biosynthesis
LPERCRHLLASAIWPREHQAQVLIVTVEAAPKGLSILVWGTYDTTKPRVRILLQGLREAGASVTEIHREVWTGVDDKSQILGLGYKLRILARWLVSYPMLLMGFARAPRYDLVLVPYMGQLDIILLWPLARLRGSLVCWDAFVSLYDTVVEDRRLVGRMHPLAVSLFALEWLACRAADRIVVDTDAHGKYFVDTFRAPPQKVRRVLVGAEADLFSPIRRAPAAFGAARPFTVLFYGQFIPLHGIETIVRAARQCDDEPIRWVLIGKGQEAPRIRALLKELSPRNLEWVEWVPYEQLAEEIAAADVCLGIFGATEKAARVIPNKVYQVLAVGRPLITMDSPAARELLADQAGVILVPQADPEALAAAVRCLARRPAAAPARALYPDLRDRISPRAVGQSLRSVLEELSRDGP